MIRRGGALLAEMLMNNSKRTFNSSGLIFREPKRGSNNYFKKSSDRAEAINDINDQYKEFKAAKGEVNLNANQNQNDYSKKYYELKEDHAQLQKKYYRLEEQYKSLEIHHEEHLDELEALIARLNTSFNQLSIEDFQPSRTDERLPMQVAPQLQFSRTNQSSASSLYSDLFNYTSEEVKDFLFEEIYSSKDIKETLKKCIANSDREYVSLLVNTLIITHPGLLEQFYLSALSKGDAQTCVSLLKANDRIINPEKFNDHLYRAHDTMLNLAKKDKAFSFKKH